MGTNLMEEYKAIFRRLDEHRRSGEPYTIDVLHDTIQINEWYNNHLSSDQKEWCKEFNYCPGDLNES